MQLTPQQQKTLIEKINQIWTGPHQCIVCFKHEFNISDRVFELREFHGGNMMIGGNSQIYPVITLTCANCGNTIFLNAIFLGIVQHKVDPLQSAPSLNKASEDLNQVSKQ